MTAPRPGERARPFGPDELDGVDGIRPDELAAEARLARDLEGVAARGGVAPGAGFADRVMAAVAVEPVPAPVIAAGSALRHGAALGFLAAIRDAFRVTFSGGFPVAVRAQALALVLLVAGVAAGSSLATAGAFGLLGDRGSPSPVPSVAAPAPTAEPAETPSPTETPDGIVPTITPSPTPNGSLEPAESEEAESASPDESAEPGEDNGGSDSGSGSAATPGPTRRPATTPKPTSRPTASPSDGPEETDTPDPSKTPRPSPSPSRSPSPSPTDGH